MIFLYFFVILLSFDYIKSQVVDANKTRWFHEEFSICLESANYDGALMAIQKTWKTKEDFEKYYKMMLLELPIDESVSHIFGILSLTYHIRDRDPSFQQFFENRKILALNTLSNLIKLGLSYDNRIFVIKYFHNNGIWFGYHAKEIIERTFQKNGENFEVIFSFLRSINLPFDTLNSVYSILLDEMNAISQDDYRKYFQIACQLQQDLRLMNNNSYFVNVTQKLPPVIQKLLWEPIRFRHAVDNLFIRIKTTVQEVGDRRIQKPFTFGVQMFATKSSKDVLSQWYLDVYDSKDLTFFIRSVKYNDYYLCLDGFRSNEAHRTRSAYIGKRENSVDYFKGSIWQLNAMDKNASVFSIRNIGYHEYLHCGSQDSLYVPGIYKGHDVFTREGMIYDLDKNWVIQNFNKI